jgi:hypothetical protein
VIQQNLSEFHQHAFIYIDVAQLKLLGHCDVTDTGKEALTPLSVKETIVEQLKDHGMRTTEENSSHEEGELSPKNDEPLNNGHGKKVGSDNRANQHSYSDDSSKSRFFSRTGTICIYVFSLFLQFYFCLTVTCIMGSLHFCNCADKVSMNI